MEVNYINPTRLFELAGLKFSTQELLYNLTSNYRETYATNTVSISWAHAFYLVPTHRKAALIVGWLGTINISKRATVVPEIAYRAIQLDICLRTLDL